MAVRSEQNKAEQLAKAQEMLQENENWVPKTTQEQGRKFAFLQSIQDKIARLIGTEIHR